eukprot:TRINITY_DN12417_c0_g1_i1.p1 TRINITY_DN12417_c0_g1~~TRINITY_DN12417_c0_g1_i1.p1  ORF type:complete len:186 (+),score=20.27 TRINITY_DN12417_c0_g1_i1:59-559(+)
MSKHPPPMPLQQFPIPPTAPSSLFAQPQVQQIQADLSSQEHSDSNPSNTLWLGGLPQNATEAEILSVFAPFGGLRAQIIAKQGRSTIAFLRFATREAALQAKIGMSNRARIGNQPIRIGWGRQNDDAVPMQTPAPDQAWHMAAPAQATQQQARIRERSPPQRPTRS